MVKFLVEPDEEEAIATWAEAHSTVNDVYQSIWSGLGEIPDRGS